MVLICVKFIGGKLLICLPMSVASAPSFRKRPGCALIGTNTVIFEPRLDKINDMVSEQVRHKPSCTITEDG